MNSRLKLFGAAILGTCLLLLSGTVRAQGRNWHGSGAGVRTGSAFHGDRHDGHWDGGWHRGWYGGYWGWPWGVSFSYYDGWPYDYSYYDYYPPPPAYDYYYTPSPSVVYRPAPTNSYSDPAPAAPPAPVAADAQRPQSDRPLAPSAAVRDDDVAAPRAAQPPPPASVAPVRPSLALPDVKALAKSGVSDEVIISQMRSARVIYHLTTAELIELKQTGVSNRVLEYMVNTPDQFAPPVQRRY